MEHLNKDELERKSPEGVEKDYTHHQENPAPSEEAIVEKNEEGGGQAMKWIIPIALVILFIVYFIYRNY
nr:hypothetical protein [Pseudopedobacter sp.]